MNAENKILIQVVDLKKHYNKGAVKALDGVSLSVKQGEVVVIIGPSGSGKSTFLRSLNLLEEPTDGHIYMDGADLMDRKVNINKHRQKMGMVFQHFNLFPHMTILKNLTFAPRKLLKKSKEEAEKKAMELLGVVGLSDRANAYPSQLSGGQKQRVAIVRALCMDPEVMLFDEPTSGLDYHRMLEVSNMIRKLNDENKIIIIVSHDFEFLGRTCDKIFDMEGCSKERR